MGTVSASISGTGSCILQFSVFYNLMEVLVRPSFELTVEMVDKDKDTVTITACGKYVMIRAPLTNCNKFMSC